MKKYRTFEVSEDKQNIKGTINMRLDEDDTSIFKKLRELGFNTNKRKNKIVWWDDDYIEIINKRTETTVGIMEMCYN